MKGDTMDVKIGVSVISLFPHFMYGGLGWVMDLIDEVGLDGVQLLPIRWASGLEKVPSEKVLSYEGAWNTGTLLEAVGRQLGYAGDENPLLLDWLLFGGKERAKETLTEFQEQFPKAVHVGHFQHEIDSGAQNFGVNPGVEKGLSSYTSIMKGNFKIVLDSLHIRCYPGETYLDWSCLREFSLKEKVSLLHLQPLRNDGGKEIRDFIQGKENFLTEFLRMLSPVRCPVIIETRPMFYGPGHHYITKGGLKDFLTGTKNAIQRDLQKGYYW